MNVVCIAYHLSKGLYMLHNIGRKHSPRHILAKSVHVYAQNDFQMQRWILLNHKFSAFLNTTSLFWKYSIAYILPCRNPMSFLQAIHDSFIHHYMYIIIAHRAIVKITFMGFNVYIYIYTLNIFLCHLHEYALCM